MATYDDIRNINQRRLNAGAALEQQNIDRLQQTDNYQRLGNFQHWDEAKEFVFKLRTEIIDYITAHGLVDGLIWNGQLQPVEDRKIVITRDMIKMVTDTFGYLTEDTATVLIWEILVNNNFVQDSDYNHTDNNLTDELLDKLESMVVDAEVNLVDDVTFNGESVVNNDKVAEIVITAEMIKEWYESNDDTNALTDALLAILEAVPGNLNTINDRLDTIDSELNSLEQYIDAEIADLLAHVDNADAELAQSISDLSDTVVYNKGLADQQYADAIARWDRVDTELAAHDNRIQRVEAGMITSVATEAVEGGTEYILTTADGYAVETHIYVPDSEGDLLAQIQELLTGYLPLTGGTLTGAISMNGNRINNLNDPSAARDAVNLQTLQNTVSAYLPLAGGSMNESAVIAMNKGYIHEITIPSGTSWDNTALNGDSVEKEYRWLGTPGNSADFTITSPSTSITWGSVEHHIQAGNHLWYIPFTFNDAKEATAGTRTRLFTIVRSMTTNYTGHITAVLVPMDNTAIDVAVNPIACLIEINSSSILVETSGATTVPAGAYSISFSYPGVWQQTIAGMP